MVEDLGDPYVRASGAPPGTTTAGVPCPADSSDGRELLDVTEVGGTSSSPSTGDRRRRRGGDRDSSRPSGSGSSPGKRAATQAASVTGLSPSSGTPTPAWDSRSARIGSRSRG